MIILQQNSTIPSMMKSDLELWVDIATIDEDIAKDCFTAFKATNPDRKFRLIKVLET